MDVPIVIWVINIVGVAIAAWFLIWRLKSKLREVEERHIIGGISHRKRIDESE